MVVFLVEQRLYKFFLHLHQGPTDLGFFGKVDIKVQENSDIYVMEAGYLNKLNSKHQCIEQ